MDCNNVIQIPSKDGLNDFDVHVVELMENLLNDFKQARQEVLDLGVMFRDDNGDLVENPAALTQRKISAEIRGWVKERPDLFGARQFAGSTGQAPRLNRYKPTA